MKLRVGEQIPLSLNFGSDLSGSDTVVIDYQKPSGIEGTWSAVANGNNAERTLQADDIDEVGKWYVRIAQTTTGETTYGEWKRIQAESAQIA